MRALVVGASGLGGALVARRLAEEGHWVRGLVRDPARAASGLEEVITGDVASGAGLARALEGIDVAFYFVHSLDARDQDARDLAAARQFVQAARASGLARGVFFTTLAVPEGVEPPLYQRNRLAVEQELLDGIPGMTAVRAGMVLGAGSRGLRPYVQLVKRAPIIPMGPWRRHRIAVVDTETVASCLLLAGTGARPLGRVVDVPASAEPTHEELVRALIDRLGLRRHILRLPWSAPSIDAFLGSIVTDDSFHFSRHLASIGRFDYVVDETRSAPFASIAPLPMRAALERALAPAAA